MRIRTMERLIWVLVFAGLFAAGFGVSLDRQGSALGWPLSIAGGLALAVGCLLIWLRSRMPP